MPRCIRCAIDGDDVTMHNGAWVHRAPGICFKKLRDVVESLQQERTGLRAELDAIKGAQVPVATFKGSVLTMGPAFGSGEDFDLYRHPAPALPVVGACVKTSHYTLTWSAAKNQNQQECERLALNEVAEYGGAAYRLYRDVTPLPTEGGK